MARGSTSSPTLASATKVVSRPWDGTGSVFLARTDTLQHMTLLVTGSANGTHPAISPDGK